MPVPKGTPFIVADLEIVSELSLIELARVVSKAIFNHELLGGLEDCIYEEVPTVYCKLLGLKFVLQGNSPNYHLACFPSMDGFDTSSPQVYITYMMLELLEKANLEVIPLGPPTRGEYITKSNAS